MRGEMTPGVTMMDALDSEPPTAGDTSRWQAVTATERGAAHRAAGLPNQDAVEVRPLDGGMVAAVADGHRGRCGSAWRARAGCPRYQTTYGIFWCRTSSRNGVTRYTET